MRRLVREYHGVGGEVDYERFKAQVRIPNKEIMVGKGEHEHVWKQLVAIVFSYLYELVCM